MIDRVQMLKHLHEAKARYLKAVTDHGFGSDEARQAFIDLTMVFHKKSQSMQPENEYAA